MNSRLFAPGLVAATLLVSASGKAQGLAENSPFLPPPRAEAATVTENPPLELRGIVGEGESKLFNIFNPATKQSAWVSLNESGQSFQVRTHDESAETVSLDYAGRPVVLKLAQAKISPLAESRPVAGGPTPVAVQPAVLPRQPTPEQQRQLENVAAEVERRRALRSANIQPPGGPVPQKN